MKFGKRLESEIVSEWRIKYIDYKGLKRMLKAVQHEKLTKEREFIYNAHKTKKEIIDKNQYHSVFVEVPPQSLHNFRIHDETSFSINPNNDRTRLSINHHDDMQKLSVNYNNNEKRHSVNNDRTFSLQSRTYSLADSVNDFLHKVSSALALQKNQDHDRAPTPVPITSLETLKDEVDPEERTFFKFIDEELVKVDKFYKLKEKESLNQFDLLIQQYEILKSTDGEKNPIFGSGTKNIVKQSLDYLKSSDGVIDYKTAKKHIKKAIFELYRGVELVRNYQILNHTGFIKILKKYDKISGRNGSDLYKSELGRRHFVISDEISKLLNYIEDFYMKNLEGVSRAQAIRKLRVPSNKNKTYYSSVLRVGLFLGMALPAIIYSLCSLLRSSGNKNYITWNLEVFSGLIIPVLLLLLIGVNFYVWTRLHINYKFIFELNPRNNLDYRQYLELPSAVLLGLSYIVLLYSYHNQTTIYPKISMILIGVVVFNPFPIFYYNARRWFIFSLIRLLGSGFLRVEFRDFFFADELNSLAYSFVILQTYGCKISDDENKGISVSCYPRVRSMILTSLLGSIPAFIRLLQCWKRYRDTYQRNHVINIGKYGSSILSTCLSSVYRINYVYGKGTFPLWFIWVTAQLFSSMYAFTWDVKMDWSLLQPNSANFLLRNKLGFKYNWFYYYAIISNFILRISWILIAITPRKSYKTYNAISVFIVAFGEMVRRWQWNFIRVENEHINNCGHFRAIKDIHLPFPLQTDNDIIAPDNGSVEEEDKDFGDSSKSFNSFFSGRLFKKRKPRRYSAQSSNDWKDYESRQDSIEYNMYSDIYEGSEESDKGENTDVADYGSDDPYVNTYTSIYTNYASRRLPPIIEDKGKQQSDSSLSI